MATITGTSGNDTINGSLVSAGVTGGVPTSGFDVLMGTLGSDALDGVGFWNRLDYNNLAAANHLTVTITNSTAATPVQGTVGKAGGGGTDTIVNFTEIDGTAGADSFTGYSLQNYITLYFNGRGGNDTINGGSSTNSLTGADYSGAPSGANINLGTGTASDGWGGTDTLINIFRVRGTGFADTITGGANWDFFVPTAGNDTYDGAGSRNNLTYNGDAILAAGTSVVVNLTAPGAGSVMKTGLQGTDTFTNVYNIEGTDQNDTFNAFAPGGGQTGYTFVYGHGGNDVFNGLANSLFVVSYNTWGVTGGVNLNLTTGVANDGQSGTDSLTGVRAVQGSSYSDTLVGSPWDDVMLGSGGSDTYSGGGGADRLDYSQTYVGTLTAVFTSAFGGTVVKSNGGTDSFSAFSAITGGTGSDTFRPSTGAVTIAGGGGSDTLSYSTATGITGVNVSFSANYTGTVTKTLTAGGSATDSFSAVRFVYGTQSADTMAGVSSASSYSLGYMNLRGEAGNDTIEGFKVVGNLLSYGDSPNAVYVKLQDSIDGSGNIIGHAQDGFQVTGQPAGTYYTDSLRNIVSFSGSAYNDTMLGSSLDDYYLASGGSDSVDLGDGNNSADYYGSSGLTGISAINAAFGAMGAGLFGWGNATVAKSGSGSGTDTIANVNRINGTPGDDILSGTTASYTWQCLTLRGGAGNDTIYGQGSTNNRADYSSATAAASIDLTAGTASDGQGGVDTLIDVRRVRGSNYNDTIKGSASDDHIEVGSSGAHVLDGQAGANRIGYAGSDAVTIDLGSTGIAAPGGYGGYVGSLTRSGSGTVDSLANFSFAIGGGGDDTILGTPGNDTLAGGQGNNLLNGYGGDNAVTFRSWAANGTPTHGGTIDLNNGLTGTASNPWDGTDTLLNILSASGSQFADTITGAVTADHRFSFIRGDGGNDLLRAPAHDEAIVADYNKALSGVAVNLGTGVTSDDGWFGGTDTLVNIQAARGSDYNDAIIGSAWSDTLFGSAGSDTLTGGGGIDLARYTFAKADATLTHNIDGSWSVTKPAAAGTDVLQEIEAVQFSDGVTVIRQPTHADIDGDSHSDILLQDVNSGAVYAWQMNGLALGNTGFVGWAPGTQWHAAATGDFNGDGRSDVLLQNTTTGDCYAWELNGTTLVGNGFIGWTPGPSWQAVGTGLFHSGDMKSDVLLQNQSTGDCYVWSQDGSLQGAAGIVAGQTGFVGWTPGPDWKVAGVGDFNGDTHSDILLQNQTNGACYIWALDGTAKGAASVIATDSGFVGWTPGANWKVRDTGDYNGDGTSDILLQNQNTGDCYLWEVKGTTLVDSGFVGWTPGPGWVAQKGGDFNDDGYSDILLQNSATGADYVWEVHGTTLVANGFAGWAPGSNWHSFG
jgi:FG-GAP-like repeat/RTX calcium-binding nonapeptide repeat (4 copies)